MESGLQGQTTLAERFSEGPAKAYNCNLELAGQFEGEGTAAGLKVFKNCAYYTTAENPRMAHPGVTVVDISDSRQPRPTAWLDTPAMLNANESLAIDRTRNLLLASKLPTLFDIYDLSADCRYPVLKSSRSLPRLHAHIGEFSPDGRTFYGASWENLNAFFKETPLGPAEAPPSAIFAIDVTDPGNLRGIATWIPPKEEWMTHAVSLNSGGTRAYVTLKRMKDPSPNGLVILDISDVQARRPNPKFRIISTLFWDARMSERALPVHIHGRPYLIWTDAAGESGPGFARIIDIKDEKHPKIVSKLMLEVHDPANWAKVMHDPTIFFGYSSLECDVDSYENAKLLACGYFEGGLRVFDIRNTANVSEIAYYKPPARRTELRPGSLFRFIEAGPVKDHTADQVLVARFLKKGREIAFISADNGFQIVRFSERFVGLHSDLFEK